MIKNKLNLLRAELQKHGFAGYIVPSNDEYLSEYVPEYAKRLEYMTGFSGSNGLAIILPKIVLFFTDGRYLTQAESELDDNLFKVFDQKLMLDIQWQDYINENEVIAYDPNLFTINGLKKFEQLNIQAHLPNLVDKIWHDQPSRPNSLIYKYPLEFAGQNWIDKIKQCRDVLNVNDADTLLITDSASVCWLLNIRASDVEFSPLLLAHAIITNNEIYLFTDKKRFDPLLRRENITILPEQSLEEILNSIGGTIIFDENQCSSQITSIVHKHAHRHLKNPCMMWKSCKNEVEIRVIQQAHIEDAVAVCEMLCFIDNNDLSNYSEYDLGLKLTQFRARGHNYKYDSFPTICGFQANGAIIHYRAEKDLAKKIVGNGLLLIDSGGQYFGGTTDITRTMAIGEVPDEYKQYYTNILKGHLALAMVRFPKNSVCGANLDALARQHLWQQGLDYSHGTGHGVGNFLSVHEGPHSISLQSFNEKLHLGMVLSNEPGFYVPGEFGIRIENMMYVKESKYTNFLEFAMLTLVPYDSSLIKMDMLNEDEKKYLKNYYQQIEKQIKNLLSEETQIWLEKQITVFI